MIDAAKLRYDVAVTAPDGEVYHLADVIHELSWEDNAGELAQRLRVTLHNTRLQDGRWLHQLVPLGTQARLLATWGEGWQEILRGTVFAREVNSEASSVELTIYDPLIYLAKSRDDRYYGPGWNAADIIRDIANAWQIPLAPLSGPNVVLPRQVWRSRTLADMLLDVLDQVRKRGGGRWLIRAAGGRMEVVRAGSNAVVYHFSVHENVVAATDLRTMERLVTRVKVVGAEDAEGRRPVEAIVDGRTEFGILQDVIYREQYDSLEAARQAAQEILAERGKPENPRTVTVPDVPMVRKGDKVHIVAGLMNGYYLVAGVSHTPKLGTMTLEVEDL